MSLHMFPALLIGGIIPSAAMVLLMITQAKPDEKANLMKVGFLPTCALLFASIYALYWVAAGLILVAIYLITGLWIL